MAFWGIEVKPGKPHTLKLEDVDGKLILTQATLGSGSSTKKSVLQCHVGDKSPVYLCTLLPDKNECCPLNLEFMEEDDVKFSVVGPTSIHLSGFIHVAGEGCDHDHYDFDQDREDIWTESNESEDYDSEEDSEVGFTDDDDVDDEMFSDSPVRNRGVVIEEIVDDEEPKKQSRMKKHSGKSNQDSKLQQLVIKGTSGVSHPVLESEDEDGFPITSSQVNKPNGQKKSDVDSVKCNKRKKDEKSEAYPDNEQNGDAHLEKSDEVAHEENLKKKKKKKKKKMKKDEVPSTETNDSTNGKIIDSSVIADDGPDSEVKQKKKKKKGDAEEGKSAIESGGVNAATTPAATNKNVSAMKEEKKKTLAKLAKPRTYANGMVVEELEMGKPDGKRATSGKKVSVRYIGKLKKNNQIFDSNLKGKPFKFILGVGQVIKGWDVGVEGMRVGDKRRLTIPPSMGYGAKGAPPAIPQNAWLVFDVELVDC